MRKESCASISRRSAVSYSRFAIALFSMDASRVNKLAGRNQQTGNDQKVGGDRDTAPRDGAARNLRGTKILERKASRVANAAIYEGLVTFAAWGPFWPCTISNSTASPSWRL